MIRIGRKIALILLPSLSVVSAVLVNLFPDILWLEWIFKVCLSGAVGIGTNSIAIKMLFRPHEKTVLGRQGLIPKRRNEIAEGIANAVSKQLLDTDSIIQYLEEKNLVQKAAAGLIESVHNWLEMPSSRLKIIGTAGRFIQNQGAEKATKLFTAISEIFKNNLSTSLSSEKIWDFIRDEIKKELEKSDTHFFVTELAKELVQKNSSLLAEFINNMLDDWIFSQGFVTKHVMKLGKGAFRIDSDRIEDELLKKVKSPSFSQDVMNLLSENLSSITALADNKAIKEKFKELLTSQKKKLNHWLKTDGIILAKNKLTTFLESENFWNWLEEYIDLAINKLEKKAEEKIHSEEFKLLARKEVRRYAQKIDVKEMVQQKVNEFELNELEALIVKVSGESLAGIELFGGILGLIAGLILINQWFIVVLLIVTGVVWLIENKIFKRLL